MVRQWNPSMKRRDSKEEISLKCHKTTVLISITYVSSGVSWTVYPPYIIYKGSNNYPSSPVNYRWSSVTERTLTSLVFRW